MAIRYYWKGYLKLSLVSCAVAMVPASSTSERTRFHNLNRQTGNRLRQRMVDEETGEEVPREDRIRGYEVEKGRYVEVTDEELEEVALESTHTIEIESFVPRAEIDKRYLDQPYYLVPSDKVSEEAFAVIREAMRDENRVAVGRVVLYRREHLVAIEALGKGMLVTTLRYASEVRSEQPYFEEIPDRKVPQEMADLARHIIEQKAAHFDPSKFEDRYENALVDLLRSKQAGHPVAHHEAPQPSNVVNLMDALRRSIANERAGGRATTRTAPAKTQRTTTRRPRAKHRKAG
ncbi:MAG TPA: Ku protein [Xanthobacteraceae bacterium]|jgi:DNA end-binding protein Ku|nr:Ku protein [Xanthobacteraceae bacterium]